MNVNKYTRNNNIRFLFYIFRKVTGDSSELQIRFISFAWQNNDIIALKSSGVFSFYFEKKMLKISKNSDFSF